MDCDHWHKEVHGNLDYEKLLPKNPALKDLLDSLAMPKYAHSTHDVSNPSLLSLSFSLRS